jgi:hypothetical protein
LIDDSDLDDRHKAGRWLCMAVALAVPAALIAGALAYGAARFLTLISHALDPR